MTNLSSTQHIQNLLAQGHSYASIGRAIGRDSSLIRQIGLGKKPGANLNQSLAELSSTGTVTTPPTRRTTRAGALAKVRAQKGHDAVTPLAPASQRVTTVSAARQQPEPLQRPRAAGRSNLRHEVSRHPNGREYHRLTVPKRSTSANRAAGNKIMGEIIDRARSQGRRLDATIWADVQRNDGSRDRIPIRLGGTGGYTGQAARDAIDAHGGNAYAWIEGQLSRRYPKGSFKSMTITGIDINTW